jgi:NTE family protein
MLEFWRVREIFAHVDADKDRFKRMLSQRMEDYMRGRIPVIDSSPDVVR